MGRVSDDHNTAEFIADMQQYIIQTPSGPVIQGTDLKEMEVKYGLAPKDGKTYRSFWEAKRAFKKDNLSLQRLEPKVAGSSRARDLNVK